MSAIPTLRKIYSLVLIRDLENKKVLLGYKKRGFGSDRWNGFGGKIEANETILECAKREVKEESGLQVIDAQKVAQLEFQFDNKMNEILEAHIFRVTKFHGNVVETDEMLPKWFNENEIPYDHMWSDDRHWFPLFLQNKLFKGHFLFNGDEKTIISHTLTVVDSIE